MKSMFLFFLPLMIALTACTETPGAPVSKESLAKETIQDNKTEAQKAHDEYKKLQEQRSKE